MSPLTHERELKWVPIDKIVPNRKNPRMEAEFSEKALERLRTSIRTHGVLEALIVMPEDKAAGTYRLIEGERRYHSSKMEGLVQLPVVIVNDMDEHDQVVMMFNIHTQRRAWEMAEEIAAVKDLVERNGEMSHDELAKELGMSTGTFKERLTVLNMGLDVVNDIATGKVDYTSALRSDQIAATMSRKRPELVQKLGGERAVERKLLAKARSRPRGISQELVQARADIIDVANVPDEMVDTYIRSPEVSWRQVRQTAKPLEDRRRVQELAKHLNEVTGEVNRFAPASLDLEQLDELRRSVVDLMVAGQELERRIVEALLNRN
jgi:ParB family chromosome partitioning protein